MKSVLVTAVVVGIGVTVVVGAMVVLGTVVVTGCSVVYVAMVAVEYIAFRYQRTA